MIKLRSTDNTIQNSEFNAVETSIYSKQTYNYSRTIPVTCNRRLQLHL